MTEKPRIECGAKDYVVELMTHKSPWTLSCTWNCEHKDGNVCPYPGECDFKMEVCPLELGGKLDEERRHQE